MKKNIEGLIIVVHGDGPIDATAEGAYLPLWEVMAKQNFAVLSWNKQGVDGSSGNWLDQSMDDRADEVVEVMTWARENALPGSSRIGLWGGSSQAGWVIPKVNGKTDVEFSILVAPAINWISQGGEFNTVKAMEQEGQSLNDIEAAVLEWRKGITNLKNGLSYESYLATTTETSPMSENRFAFVNRNYLSDSVGDLKKFNSPPVLLILGGKDINVDTEQTKLVYEANVKDGLLHTIWISETDHFMLDKMYIGSELLLPATYVIAPKRIFSREYTEAVAQFLEKMGTE